MDFKPSKLKGYSLKTRKKNRNSRFFLLPSLFLFLISNECFDCIRNDLKRIRERKKDIYREREGEIEREDK